MGKLADDLDGPTNYEYRTLDSYSAQINLSHTESSGGVHPASAVKNEQRAWLDGPACNPEDPNQFQIIGTPNTTAQVHPRLFCETLVRALTQHKHVTIREGVPVQGLRFGEKDVTSIILSNGEIIDDADDIVLALGPWTATIVSQWLQTAHPAFSQKLSTVIQPAKYYSVVIEPKTNEDKAKIPAAVLFLSLQNEGPRAKQTEPEIYPRSSGQVYLCGTGEDIPLPSDPSTVEASVAEKCDILTSIAGSVSSLLQVEEQNGVPATADLLVKQACYLPLSDTGLPLMGRVPNTEHLWIAAGHGCWGILNSPATGAVMAEMIHNSSDNTSTLLGEHTSSFLPV